MILQPSQMVNELFTTQTPDLLTAMPCGSKSDSLGFSASSGTAFFGAMLKAAAEWKLERNCEVRQTGMSSSGFYILIQIPQAKTREIEQTIWDTLMNHTWSGGWSSERRGSTVIALRGEYQHVHALFSPWGTWANGRGTGVILWDDGRVSWED